MELDEERLPNYKNMENKNTEYNVKNLNDITSKTNKSNKILIICLLGLLVALILYSLCSTILNINANKKYTPEHYTEVYRGDISLKYEGAKCDLVEDIQNYMDSVAPYNCLSGRLLLEQCETYNVDVIFALAQAQLESCFGTCGIAKKTNSVFNVMSYDGRSANEIIKKGHGYKHPDYSVEPYLKLLTEKYLIDGKTEKDLLAKFVNKDGKRYASATDYETKLLKIYTSIYDKIESYKIYNKYKTILER